MGKRGGGKSGDRMSIIEGGGLREFMILPLLPRVFSLPYTSAFCYMRLQRRQRGLQDYCRYANRVPSNFSVKVSVRSPVLVKSLSSLTPWGGKTRDPGNKDSDKRL